jgi:hypothetical protein
MRYLLKLGRVTYLQMKFRILLLLMNFGKFQKIYTLPSTPPSSQNAIEEWATLIRKTGGKLKTTCLVQALTLKYLAPEVHLRIGVNNAKGFEAHAWVEYEGKVILGDLPDFGFVPIWEMA